MGRSRPPRGRGARSARTMGAVTRPPTALDLFCGCGGIAAGLRSAGFHILAGVDVEPHYMSTFSHNFPEARGVLGDLSGIDPLRFMRGLSLEAGDLDLLAGGPPCQGFSKNVPRSRRSAEDRNNGLMRTFLRYAEVLRPRAVLMENVAEMRNGFDRAYTDEVLGRLERAGYAVAHETLNAADYGVPQRRRRAFFVGLSSGRAFAFPGRTHFAESPRLSGSGDPHVTVWDAIGDLPSVDHASEQRLHRYRRRPFTDYQRQAEARIGDRHEPQAPPAQAAPVRAPGQPEAGTGDQGSAGAPAPPVGVQRGVRATDPGHGRAHDHALGVPSRIGKVRAPRGHPRADDPRGRPASGGSPTSSSSRGATTGRPPRSATPCRPCSPVSWAPPSWARSPDAGPALPVDRGRESPLRGNVTRRRGRSQDVRRLVAPRHDHDDPQQAHGRQACGRRRHARVAPRVEDAP